MTVAMVLAGGVALGAYQAGAYAAMAPPMRARIGRLVGVSIGAVNAVIIAGNPPGRRAEALARFWEEAGRPNVAVAPPAVPERAWAAARSWLDVAQTRTLGRSGVFEPQPASVLLGGDTLGLYRLRPLGRRLERFVDFERVNGGDIRLSVLATDLETGEPVVFDTARGDVLRPEHVLASCGFVPDFEPTAIDGRLLGDGALAANAPVELVLAEQAEDEDLTCFVLDLFSRDRGPARSLGDAAEIRRDLLLANPTHRALAAVEREDALRRRLAAAVDRLEASGDVGRDELKGLRKGALRGATTVVHLSYRSAPGEGGPEMQFNFSAATLARRRAAGADDMAAALELLPERPRPGFVLHRIRRTP